MKRPDCGLLSSDLAAGILRVKGVRRLGVRVGNWLTAVEGKKLLGTETEGHFFAVSAIVLLLVAKNSLQRPARDKRCSNHAIIGRERIRPWPSALENSSGLRSVCVRHVSRKALAFGIALSCCSSITRLSAQSQQSWHRAHRQSPGTVVNSVTHEPINRALVFSPDNQFAAMTDDRGHFEFTFPRQKAKRLPGLPVPQTFHALETSQLQGARTNRPAMLIARKTGFLSRNNGQEGFQISPAQQETHNLPRARSSCRWPRYSAWVRWFRQNPGRALSTPGAGGPRALGPSREWRWSRSDGEFRFAELSGGSYKLLTHELLDRDPLTFNPRGQLFGYPPVYYPAASDFANGRVIRLSPGENLPGKTLACKARILWSEAGSHERPGRPPSWNSGMAARTRKALGTLSATTPEMS